MTDRNRKKQMRNAECGMRNLRTFLIPKSEIRNPKSARRGVLLLVVLSMLVLFMLVGTTFLMTSSQYRTGAKNAARLNQFENKPSDLLERALKQVLRDTQNPHSVARYHSLLRDMYGSDGFQALILNDSTLPPLLQPQYAGTALFGGDITVDRGPTNGQIVEIFMRETPSPTPSPRTTFVPTLDHVLKLELDANGQPQDFNVPRTDGYYNGSLLTILSGPAAGQTTRILEFEFAGDNPNVLAALNNPATPPPLWCMRLMVFSRSDGSPLVMPTDLQGAQFMINGRPFNGTGVGYNPLAAVGSPRLSAAERVEMISGQPEPVQVALAPNAVYHNPAAIWADLNNQLPNYPFQGAGDTDESYDAADFQNMYLALLSVMPRARGRIMDTAGTIYEADDPAVRSLVEQFNNYKPIIDDVPIPSFHRPDLIHYWYHRLFNAPWLNGLSEDERTAVINRPYRTNGQPSPGLNAQQAAMIAAIKRKIFLRPLEEDHPNFDGSNPLSIPQFSGNGRVVTTPPWPIIGPWDVDNDNDGIPDSIWIDLGDPIQETADGKLYKPLYAFLIVDQDGKLNLNAHGSSEHLVNTPLDPTINPADGSGPGNLAHDPTNANHVRTSNLLATGNGWGPAEISLRPILSPNVAPNFIGDRRTDDYARLFSGRLKVRLDVNGNEIPDLAVAWGRHGSEDTATATGLLLGPTQPYIRFSMPGVTFVPTLPQPAYSRDRHTWYNFFGVGYPEFSNSPYSAFGHLPDLSGRYAVGLDYTGQPVYETAYEPTPRRMVDDSPYELNLNEAHRNDAVADSLSMVTSYTSVAPVDDDAPFAPTELERLLRAFDPDAAALPDRLWNLVDAFDPAKLATTPVYLNAFSDASARLAQAQLDASINRRSVTTESWDTPVPAGNMYTRCLLGADGQPGIAGVDDDNNSTIDDATEIGAVDNDFQTFDPTVDSDDYVSVMRHLRTVPNGPFLTVAEAQPPQSATVVDYLRYRIILELLRKGVINDADGTNNVVAADQLANPIIENLMAPDLLAGLKMDLNRPFGDGQDNPMPNANNLGNGVVDEPLEAGEPFFDTNGNGVWDAGEPYIDIDGSGDYTQPLDRALVTVNPPTYAPFDYGHPADGVGKYIDGNTARQRYARHLYVLALLTMDENYVAPYDEDSLQLRTWIDKVKKDLTDAQPGLAPEEAELIARKKLTYREVAQWAINCADMRDADVIMTPFEYDENPWDGWNVTEYDNNGNVVSQIPIDGDPATDENAGFTWTLNGIDQVASPAPPATFHTRGVVWGAERPELLITETIGLHDRRTEDLASIDSEGHGTLNNSDNNKWNDEDLDQRHRPRGSLFVEVYNPWSRDGQRPAELYSIHPRENDGSITRSAVASPGVELGRVSDLFVTHNGIQKRSPVWRMIVVEEHPEYRNDDPLDNQRFDADVAGNVPNPPPNTPFRYSDPDFPGFDYSFKPNRVRTAPQPPNERRFDDRKENGPNWNRNIFSISYPYVEREFYFTTNHSPTIDDISPNRGSVYRYTSSRYDVGSSRDIPKNQAEEFRLWIPDRSISYRLGQQLVVAQTQKFVHPEAEHSTDPLHQISPVIPGAYCVIGSAGTQYTGNNPGVSPDAFTTIVSRWKSDSERNNQSGSQFRPNLARRIELRVDRTQLGQLISRVPAANQAIVVKNGGLQAAPRDNELLTGTPTSGEFGPAVAIPVEGMNISEPSWEYQAREFEMAQKDSPEVAAGSAALRFTQALAKGEGMYAKGAGPRPGSPDSYDTPFDDAPELERTGTTFNYRMIHLQRLANPLLPWNPAPGEFTDNNGNEQYHNPSLPVNPYRTVDSSSADLTAFNGISSAEADQDNTIQGDKNQYRPWVRDVGEVTAYHTGNRQWCLFRSHERCATAALATLQAQGGAGAASLPVRAIWQQEPPKDRFNIDYFRDLLPWDPNSQITMDRLDGRWTLRGRDTRPEDQDGEAMHVDMVLEHSLGFGNEAIGRILSVNDTLPTASALGTPAAESGNNTLQTDATYPWLAWNNRPYSSAMELLQIPSGSSSEMLRNYSVANPNSPADPYNGGQPTGTPTPEDINDFRDANRRGHFGHLMNFFQSAPLPADLARDNTGQPVLDGTGQDAKYVPIGAGNFYRLLDYVHVPTKFVGNDTLLNPIVFNRIGQDLTVNTVDDVANPLDPRQSLVAPLNRVSHHREPGRVNLNTVIGRTNPTLPTEAWSEVYDGLMHRTRDADRFVDIDSDGQLELTGMSHLGPAWRDIVVSRRGYIDPSNTANPRLGNSPWALNFNFPTIFANPFRSGDAGDLVPLEQLLQYGVDATFNRVHPFTRGADNAWGALNVDDDELRAINPASRLIDNVREAGFGDDALSFRANGAIPHDQFEARSRYPLMAESLDVSAIDGDRNPGLSYSALNRLGSMATTRSNVFAVWVTVGFFEVEPVSETIRQRYDLTNAAQRELFTRIYPQGYMLAQEIGSETGDIKRHRAFYIIDRTLPVAFKPGEDINVENIIKLRRRIE